MKISTKGRYALVIMLNLASNYESDKFISLKDISEKENVSLKYLEKIMLNLKKYDFFISSRGVDGGYKLANDPYYYKIGDILRAAEGDLAPVSCISDESTCNKSGICKTMLIWKDLNDAINNHLDSKTLGDYIEGSN